MKILTRRHEGFFILGIISALSCLPVSAQVGGAGLGNVLEASGSASLAKALAGSVPRRGMAGSQSGNANQKPNTGGGATRPGQNSKSVSKSIAAGTRNPAPAAPNRGVATRFRSTGTLLKGRELAALIGRNDSEKEQLAQLFQFVWQEYEKEARRLGSQPNDVALALSFFLTGNAAVYHETPEAEDEQVLALRDKIADTLARNDAFNGATDRQKQEMSEFLISFTGLAFIGYQDAKQSGNAENVKNYRNFAGANLQALTGVAPDKIKLADEGLVIDDDSADAAPVSN